MQTLFFTVTLEDLSRDKSTLVFCISFLFFVFKQATYWSDCVSHGSNLLFNVPVRIFSLPLLQKRHF